jgi:hypothetical protein
MPGKKSKFSLKNDNEEIIIYQKIKTKIKKVSFSPIVKIIKIESFKKYNK